MNHQPQVLFQDQYGFVDEVVQAGEFSHSLFVPAWGFKMDNSTIDAGNLILSKYSLSDLKSFHTHNHYHVKEQSNRSLSNTRVWQACTVKLPGGKTLSVANYQGYVTGTDPNGDDVTTETMEKVRGGLASLSRAADFLWRPKR